MFNPSARRNRKIILFAAAILVTGTSMTFAQGGGVGGAGAGGAASGASGGAPSTPSTASSGGATSHAHEEATTDRSEPRSKARSVHHHRGRAAEIALGSYYCGSSPCFRIYPPTIYGYAAAPVPGAIAPLYRESTLWWPGYYDYAPGQWGRGFPRYGGYGRRAGYHGD